MVKTIIYSFFHLNNWWGTNQDLSEFWRRGARKLQKLTHLQNLVPMKMSVLQEEYQRGRMAGWVFSIALEVILVKERLAILSCLGDLQKASQEPLECQAILMMVWCNSKDQRRSQTAKNTSTTYRLFIAPKISLLEMQCFPSQSLLNLQLRYISETTCIRIPWKLFPNDAWALFSRVSFFYLFIYW